MKIKILGTRGEIEASAPYHSRQSGVLIDNFLMLDLGEEEFLKYRPKNIFITHLHPDHALFTRRGFHYGKPISIPIYAPEKYQGIKINILSKKKKFGSYSITPVPAIHSQKVKSFAYLIQRGKRKILYTGDMIWINKKYHRLLKHLDLVITDGSFVRRGGMIRRDKKTGKIYGHNGIPELIKLFKRFSDNILFIHFGSWFYNLGAPKAKAKLKKLGQECGVKVIAGHEGLKLTVGAVNKKKYR